MVRELEIFVALIFLLLGILGIFNARFVIRNRFKSEKENLAVNMFKFISFLVCVLSLIFIYFKG